MGRYQLTPDLARAKSLKLMVLYSIPRAVEGGSGEKAADFYEAFPAHLSPFQSRTVCSSMAVLSKAHLVSFSLSLIAFSCFRWRSTAPQ